MNKEYPVFFEKEEVGIAHVERCALYYLIKCRCNLSKTIFFRILVSVGGKEKNLGICIPNGEYFYLETQVPVKYLGEGEFAFRVVAKTNKQSERFIPIQDATPFCCLAELNKACLSERDGVRGVLISE